MVQWVNGGDDSRADGETELSNREFDAGVLPDGLTMMIRKAMTVVSNFTRLVALIWDRLDGDVHGF